MQLLFYSMTKIIVLFILLFIFFILFLWQETQLFARQVKVQVDKSTFMNIYQSKNADSGGK